MQALLLTSEKACKGVVDGLALGVSCFTGLDNDFDTEASCVVVEADSNAEEVAPGTGVYKVPMKISTLETAPETNEKTTTFSNAVFAEFAQPNIVQKLIASGSNYFVYAIAEPSFSNAVIGDTWVQTLNFKMHCTLTA